MIKKELKDLDLTLYEETLSNGLKIYIVPKKGNNIYVTLTAKYGSDILEFKNVNKDIKVVPGIAHFLEHKVFEVKDKIEPFAFYSKNGADCNASTTHEKTTYMFSSTDKLSENLNYLLDFVLEPYFTDENVEKEKGIIKEEITMIADNPFSKLNDTSLYNSFNIHPIKNSIGGKVEDIEKINKEMLYDVYNSFYNPNNMFIVVTGNVDEKEVIEIIKENQKKKKFNEYDTEIKEYEEKDNVFKKEETIYLPVSIPKLSVNIKINIENNTDYPLFLKRCALFHFFQIKFGSTSIFQEKLKKEGLITEDFGLNMVKTDKHFLFMILGESDNIELLKDKILEELKDTRIDDVDIERRNKVLVSSAIYMSDSVFGINNKIVNNIIDYNEYIEDIPMIKKLTPKVVKEIISKTDFSNVSTVIVKKEDK